MAAPRKRARQKIRFELSRSGIGGIAIVCFCIFLWMFIFGVWAGQSLLKPSQKIKTGFDAGSVQEERAVIHLDEKKKIKP